MIPAFVAYCALGQNVILNHEYTDYKWCNLDEAQQLAVFANQRQLYAFVWENFVLNQPSELLKLSK